MTAQTITLSPGDTLTVNVSAITPIPPIPPLPTGGPSIKIVNGKFVDGNRNPLRFKGANLSGMEFAYIQGWGSATDPLSGQCGPAGVNFAALKASGVNAIRLPFNTASMLQQTTYDYSGAARIADKTGKYPALYKSVVDAATAAGMIVEIDCHWSAPNMVTPGSATARPFSPMAQGPAPDLANAIAAWTYLASTYKDYPNAILCAFNEWMADQWGGKWPTTPPDYWTGWRDGGTLFKFPNNSTGGSNYDFVQDTKFCGMQDIVNAIRATGATNVISLGGINWAGDLSGWVARKPVDPLNQLAAEIHIYPAYGTAFGTPAYNAMPTARMAVCQAIQAAGFPVIIGEVGGHNAAGTPNEPFTTGVLDWAVAQGISYFGWTWDVWQNADNVLIKDGAGTPTDGYGVVFKAHA